MIYNQNNLNVAKVASKTGINPELRAVAFFKDKTVATDRFRLIEMSTPAEEGKDPLENYPTAGVKNILTKLEEPLMLEAKTVSKLKILKVKQLSEIQGAVLVDAKDGLGSVQLVSTDLSSTNQVSIRPTAGSFPKYEMLMPSEESIKEDYAVVEINAEYLAEVLQILSKLDGTHCVTLGINKKVHGKPVIVFAKNNEQTGRGLVMPLNK